MIYNIIHNFKRVTNILVHVENKSWGPHGTIFWLSVMLTQQYATY